MKKIGPEPLFLVAGFDEDPFEAGALGAFGAVGAAGALGATVEKPVDTTVDAEPLRVGTSGTTTVIVEPFAARDELFFTVFLVAFLVAFFTLFLTGRFAAVAFFATFLTGRFAAAFFGADFFATFFTGRLAADFFAVFLAVRFAATYSTP